jgi:hypothetical protein
VNSGGSFGASPLQQHIGLGPPVRRAGSSASAKATADKLDPANGRVDVEITWPVSRTTQRFSNVPRNQILRIREGEDRYSQVKRAS